MTAVAQLAALVELVRAPAALTVPGDTIAGAAIVGRRLDPASVGLAAASICLYWGGMALNDMADRDVDAVERPHRPIPSGRVTPRTAFALATGLTAAGIGIAGLAGGPPALIVAVPLAATVWVYDLALKSTPLGPAAMATARALDVMLGAGPHHSRRCLPAALVVAGHTYVVTELSRREVQGSGQTLPKVTLVATTLVILATAAVTRRRSTRLHQIAGMGLLGAYAGTFGAAQAAVVRDPGARHVQQAVGAGILGLVPLQAAITACSGRLRAAGALALLFPVARTLARRVSPT